MKLSTLLDTDKLAKHITDGLVSVREHPKFPLKIFNYTPKATFSGIFDDITNYTRGLIVDDHDVIVARPFKKFMNLSDTRYPETMLANLPQSIPLITEKIDGSMGEFYMWMGEAGIATRGSFTSEQAVWATDWYLTHRRATSLPGWPTGYTPVFEIIWSKNRIVVDYDYEGLVLLALVNIETGAELCRPDMEYWAARNRIPAVKVYEKSLEEAMSENLKNFEGYVVSWPVHNAPAFKIKLKQDDYRRLHKILTGVSPIGIWELLKDGKSAVEVLCKDDVPKSFADWVEKWENDLKQEWYKLSIHVEGSYAQMLMENTQPRATRKDYALWIKGNHPELAGYLFARLDGRDYSPMIWKSLRPQGDVFKRDEA